MNAGGSDTLELLVVQAGTQTPGCTFKEIAYDGVYLDAAQDARLGKTFLPPAGRADWLIVCNNPGNYEVIVGTTSCE